MAKVTINTRDIFVTIEKQVVAILNAGFKKKKSDKPDSIIDDCIFYYGMLDRKKKANGHGCGINIKTGDVYTGNWRNNMMTGIGYYEINTSKKAIYIGELINNNFHGYGKISFEESNNGIKSYEGFWNNNQPNHYGKIIYSDGSIYNGNVNEGIIRHGTGIMQWSNGSKYDGMWKNDTRTGKGIFTCPKGNVHDGQWVNDKKHGMGVANEDGMKFICNWIDNEKHGKGCLRMENGDLISCRWKNGIMSNKCRIAFANNDFFSGHLIAMKPFNAVGKYVYKDGSKYIGQIIDDCLSGNGIWVNRNGTHVHCEWVNGKKHGQVFYYDPLNEYVGISHWSYGCVIHGSSYCIRQY